MLDLLLAVHPEEFIAPGGVGMGMVALWAINNRKNGNGHAMTKILVTLEFMLVELREIRRQRD